MKNEEYRFLVATKINQDGVDCKRAIYVQRNVREYTCVKTEILV
jgi:hypothetical protein